MTDPTLRPDALAADRRTIAMLEAVRQRGVQAIGAGLSTRNWHAVETAYNEVRDRIDDILIADRAVHRALALLRDHPRQPEWRTDMENAPRGDGRLERPSLILFPGPYGEAAIARWDDDRYAKKPRPFWSFDATRSTTSRAVAPTHWRPLPTPPLPIDQQQEPGE